MGNITARSPKDDVIDVPRREGVSFFDDAWGNNFKGIISSDVASPFPHNDPYPGFFNFAELMRGLQSRFWRIALKGDEDDDTIPATGSDSTFGSVPKNESISTVKVVDGHKVEYNESTYGDKNSVYKVRVINIRPLDSGETVETSPVSTTKLNNNGGRNPVTFAPKYGSDSEEIYGRREPLEKNDTDNEVQDIESSRLEVKKY